MANKYIGITIGPIFDTMNLTSSPVALWAASYMFSLLSRSLCEVLTEYADYGVAEEDIISPYYSKNEPLFSANDGVGLFHDRVIFASKGFDMKTQFVPVRDEAISRVAFGMGIDFDELKKYVMVSAVEFESEKPLIDSGKILDCVELAKPFVEKEKLNPIVALFTGDNHSKNTALKEIPVINALSDFQLKIDNKGSFKSIDSIVNTGDGYKKYNYYAIVRSDADNMGKVISSLKSDEEIREFSRQCLMYCSEIAKVVKEYDGVTIYSGGDDLLAIMPCESRSKATIFDFILNANKTFDKYFGLKSEFRKTAEFEQSPSLSFGVTIAFKHFPLYEALSDSANLLFGIAKKDKKNRVAIRLQKHSGQSEGLVIDNCELEYFSEMLDYIVDKKSKNDTNDRVFLSALHKIAIFEKSVDAVKETTEIENLFINIFDGPEHKDNTFLLKKLPDILQKLNNEAGVYPLNPSGIVQGKPSLTMQYLLRMFKFFVEKDSADERKEATADENI